jgi:hypothetical protein
VIDWRKKKRKSEDLCENVFGQTGALEEGYGFGTADTAVSIQIGTSEISIEEIYIRCWRCHQQKK